MSPLLLALLAWIGSHTDYAVPTVAEELPAVERLEPLALARLVHPNAPEALLRSLDILGSYDPTREPHGTIFISAALNLDDEHTHAVLVHELVHFLQVRSGLRYACPGQMEPEAYRVTRAWLAERGFPDPSDDMLILLAASCAAH